MEQYTRRINVHSSVCVERTAELCLCRLLSFRPPRRVSYGSQSLQIRPVYDSLICAVVLAFRSSSLTPKDGGASTAIEPRLFGSSL